MINRIVLWLVCFTALKTEGFNSTLKCGKDKSPHVLVYEGLAKIQHFPWLGRLIYPLGLSVMKSTVVLVTRQLVLGSAKDIDNMPKDDFREIAKVILGHNCDGPKIGVLEYAYHPEYEKDSYSSLALIQLETSVIDEDVMPVCAPALPRLDPQIYAFTVSDDCSSIIKIHKMMYVSDEECKVFYRRSELDVAHMWPRHSACARAVSGGECVWRSGAVLVMRQGGYWRLMGFGVHGPGCEAPARFMDYGMYYNWVNLNVARMGQPAVTRLDSNYIIMRRTGTQIQRYGRCDKEEIASELYNDEMRIETSDNSVAIKTIRYNVTIYSNLEYSCVIFRAHNILAGGKPRIALRRYCSNRGSLCFDANLLAMSFFVEIFFMNDVVFKVIAYGQPFKVTNFHIQLRNANSRLMYKFTDTIVPNKFPPH